MKNVQLHSVDDAEVHRYLGSLSLFSFSHSNHLYVVIISSRDGNFVDIVCYSMQKIKQNE